MVRAGPLTMFLAEWIFGRFCQLPILSRLVAQIITPVHAAPRLTNLFPKGGHGRERRHRSAHRPIGCGHLTFKQPKTVRCANLTVEAQRAPAGKLIPIGSRMTCTAHTVASRIRKRVETGWALRWATNLAIRVTYFPAI
jgi:hypothetical protein